jgi:ADP-heptose:LPS heptosyltransferase
MLIHTDCRFYEGAKPCDFHKRDGRLCDGCKDYDQITFRILIVKLAAVGDVLRTTSILPALKKKYSGSQITWITKSSAAPLLKGNPFIDRVFVTEGNYMEYLQNEQFDLGICLDADPQSATLHSVARCKERCGFVSDSAGRVQPVDERAHDWWLMGLNDAKKKANRSTYQATMYGICGLDLPTQPPQLALNGRSDAFGKEFLEKNSALKRSKRILGINTGGGGRWQYKKWTFEGYVGFIRLMERQHSDTGIVIVGGPEEVELNERIMKTIGPSIVDAGCNNSLMEFGAIINTFDVLLTSDSLGMHVGVALRKPTIVLVGPTSPWELDVFGKGDILHSDIDCLVCYLSRCDKTVTCMSTLSPEYVLSKVEQHLS